MIGERDTLRSVQLRIADIYIIIGEHSEPLSRVFNDQPSGIYMVESVRTYVSNTHAHVRMSVCY